jgi:phospholipid/cholesterol/gamma-HCH transport system substrate-binding protein
MRRLKLLLALLVGSIALTGCDFSIYNVPLPGGADVGDNPIHVTVEFQDVLDLVPQSAVKVNDISVGRVTSVDLNAKDYTATVGIELRNDTDLPDNAIATIRQTSLLGEKFVSLAPPLTGATGSLSDGDTIPLDHTGRNPEVEEVLGALSLVLNGGGVAQLKTITTELNNALGGREDAARSVLTQIKSLMSQLDSHKADIVDAIDSLNRLSIEVRQQQGSIDQALEELPSALDSIDRQRHDLVRMLDGLNRLSDVGVRVIQATHDSTVTSLQQLQPVLTNLSAAGQSFVKAFNVFYAFPFVDDVVGRDPQVARNLHMGDYVNLSINLDLDINNLALPDLACIPINMLPDNTPLEHILDIKGLCAGVTKVLQSCLKTPPDPAACAKLPQYLLNEICDAVHLPLLCGNGGLLGGGGGGGNTSSNPITDLLHQLGLGLGGVLPRPAPGGDQPHPVDYSSGVGLFLSQPLSSGGSGR